MLARRGEEQKVDDETIAKLFEKHIQQVVFWMQNQPKLNYLDIEYNEMLKNPQPQLEAIVKFLGRELDIDTMAAVVDPELYRQRK
jgi:hypothetical protein